MRGGVPGSKRAYKPDSVPPLGAAAISLVPPLLEGSSSLPGDAVGLRCPSACEGLSPYLALLRVGFASAPCRHEAWCALTAPFHPCL